MKSSESIKNLAEALCNAQSEMGGAVENKKNPFFKSDYADLSSVIKAVKEPFARNGLSYTQFPIDDNGRVGVVTLLMHKSGEYLENSYTLPTTKPDPQSAGSAITYARRYALQSIAGIPTADDDAESAMLRSGEESGALISRAKIHREEDNTVHIAALRACTTLAGLQSAFTGLDKHIQGALISVKDEMKEKLS